MTEAGGVWTIGRGDRQTVVKDSRGLRMISMLIDNAGREVHALELTGAKVEQADTGPV